ncbi:MAG: sugar phosphate isomerase/epimerase, partial [Spirochaetales bacterium]|nr:sugar phosphate isomerase/epimerase [Spirochaetales bacterium]
SMDWRAFVSCLMEKGFEGAFSIENEGANSRGTGIDSATEQGFAACLGFMKPMIWPLDRERGYVYGEVEALKEPSAGELPLVDISNLSA